MSLRSKKSKRIWLMLRRLRLRLRRLKK